jgi:NAD(P)-dependent dehydrogenase (short-subunit alcohol dehydrogenase family)
MLGWPETPFTERRTIAALQELERQGASVDVMPANVTDRGQMQLVIDSMLQRYGRIDGVIHGAGIVRAGLIQTKTREVAESVLAPKVAGTALLFELLRPVQPDFLVLFSSITSLLTPYAESDYSAANCFLDVFSAYANAHGMRTLSINWPGWREAGQLADLVVRPGLEGWKEAALRKAIATRDGVEAFHRALHSNLAQVIVSPENLGQLMVEAEAEFDPSQYLDRAQPGALRAADPDAPPARQNTVEATLLEMWRGMFGLQRIDVHEPFISLGGHSLLAMQIVARIRSSYQIPFTVRDFFENSTIAQLSELIEKRVRSEIESLSEEQIRWLISNE